MFSNCSNLSTINIPPSVSYIGASCFFQCSNLGTINIHSSVSSIGNGCFSGCNKLEGNVQIEPNNRKFGIYGTRIYRKNNNKEVRVWD